MNKIIAIIGGGLAGLSLSIDLKKRGFHVVLIEKGNYPRHKVCGEYISMESKRYLESICPELIKLHLPLITEFRLTSTGKQVYQTHLDLGGFGISRYKLEELLYEQAIKTGVNVLLNCKATSVNFDNKTSRFAISTSSGIVEGDIVCNASGRKSVFETVHNPNKKSWPVNYVGVKYHVKADRNSNTIEIHNFPGGYCGISSIEDSISCLCYLVNSNILKQAGSIPNLEKTILSKNKNLSTLLSSVRFLTPQPLTVSGINFLIKTPVNDNMIFLGDAAGSIAPITGNGMSIALRSSAKLAESIQNFSVSTSTEKIKKEYIQFWNSRFSGRIKISRYIQKLSEFPALTNTTIRLMNAIPLLGQQIIKSTHGQPF